MGDIVKMSNYYRWGKEKIHMFTSLINRIVEEKNTGKEYSLLEVDEVAEEILKEASYYNNEGSTPIVKIVKDFEFQAYKEKLEDGLSGDISIYGKTEELYEHDKVILVNETDHLFHQRFVVAHELAHYLFDYLGSEAYKDKKITFSDTYMKDKHDTIHEKRANRFAAAILMPRELFIKQYNYVKGIDNNRMLAITYLSRYFKTTPESIEKRIAEVTNNAEVFN